MLFRSSCHLLFDHFQFALIHGPNIPGSYAILLSIALDLASITSHIHNWVLFLLWFYPFILSGVISPLISSSILGTYWPGDFLFQIPVILPFHTIHGVLKGRILKWFAISFSRGSFRPRDRTWVSRIVSRCFTICATMEIYITSIDQNLNSVLKLGQSM